MSIASDVESLQEVASDKQISVGRGHLHCSRFYIMILELDITRETTFPL